MNTVSSPEIEAWMWNAAYTVAIFVAGNVARSWLTVRGDRRKEFNAVADPIAVMLEDQCHDPSPETEIDLREIRRHFSKWQVQRFDKVAWEYYLSVGSENIDEVDDRKVFIDRQRVRQAAEKLLVWLDHK